LKCPPTLYFAKKLSPGTRDDFRRVLKPYIDNIVEIVLNDVSEERILSEIKSLFKGVEYEHETKYLKSALDRIRRIDKTISLHEMNLNYYLTQKETSLNQLYDYLGYPKTYYFYESRKELKKDEMPFRMLESEHLIEMETFRPKWQELMESGLSWINMCYMGYWRDGMVLSIEHNCNFFNIPRGMTHVNFSGEGRNKKDYLERTYSFTNHVEVLN
jgi:hypothetical protein